MVVDADWRGDLERWLEPFLAGLSHPARRRMCPQYVAGLIGPGDRTLHTYSTDAAHRRNLGVFRPRMTRELQDDGFVIGRRRTAD